MDAMIDAALIAIASASGAAFFALLINKMFPKVLASWKAKRDVRHRLWDQLGTMCSEWNGKFERIEAHMGSVQAHMAEADVARGKATKRFDDIDNVLMTILSMTLGQFEMWELPSFLCDANGSNLNVNKAYARRLRLGRDDLMEYRYRRQIHASCYQAVNAAFASAKQDHREFEMDIVMCDVNRQEVYFRLHMIPFPRAIGPATRWIGTLTEIDPSDTSRSLT